jgi:hypothetical protein
MIYWGQDHDRFKAAFRKFGAVLSLEELLGSSQDEEATQPLLMAEISVQQER